MVFLFFQVFSCELFYSVFVYYVQYVCKRCVGGCGLDRPALGHRHGNQLVSYWHMSCSNVIRRITLPLPHFITTFGFPRLFRLGFSRECCSFVVVLFFCLVFLVWRVVFFRLNKMKPGLLTSVFVTLIVAHVTAATNNAEPDYANGNFNVPTVPKREILRCMGNFYTFAISFQ